MEIYFIRYGKGALILTPQKLLIAFDSAGDEIHACPYCHRYVKRERGVRVCLGCYGVVDNNRLQVYTGRVNFSGGQSWLKNPLAGIFKGK